MMALSWNVSDVKDHENVCFFEATEDDPMNGVTKGDRLLNPVTNALIWSTISVDLPGITELNAPEFYARVRIHERLWGPWLIRAEVDGVRPQGEAAFITMDEVLAHVGLSCNVSPVPRAKWLKRVSREMDKLAETVQREQGRVTVDG